MERLTAEQLKVIDLSLIEWYYEQAMVRHNDLVRVESLITERGYTLFAIYFGILTAAIGYILTHLSVNDDDALTSGCFYIYFHRLHLSRHQATYCFRAWERT
mgnify:CR=1 FL=1